MRDINYKLRRLLEEHTHGRELRSRDSLDEDFSTLEKIAETSVWDDCGWAPAQERIVASILSNIITDDTYWFRRGLASELFIISELIDSVSVGDGEVLELWNSRPIRFPRTRRYDALNVVSSIIDFESHDIGLTGWHFHPVKNGQRLGYRMLFSPDRAQSDLWWESHGTGNRPHGDPSVRTLSATLSKKYYNACLAKVRDKSVFPRGESYRRWSSRFVLAGKSTFLAHCDLRGVATSPEPFAQHFH